MIFLAPTDTRKRFISMFLPPVGPLFSDVDPAIAESSADGWGGDWYVAWRQGDQTCVRSHIQADDADALDGYAELLERWVTLGDREIFYPTADLIRVTACG